MLRTVGALTRGRVPATGIMRTRQGGDRPPRLAPAFAEFGRIDKTLHTVTSLDDEATRRATLIQLTRGAGRQAVARAGFPGKRGARRQRSRAGQDTQRDALGGGVNMIVLWNTSYMQAALDQHRADGHSGRPEDEARLSPLGHEHINLLGRYSFAVPESVARGELRPLRHPADGGRSPYFPFHCSPNPILDACDHHRVRAAAPGARRPTDPPDPEPREQHGSSTRGDRSDSVRWASRESGAQRAPAPTNPITRTDSESVTRVSL